MQKRAIPYLIRDYLEYSTFIMMFGVFPIIIFIPFLLLLSLILLYIGEFRMGICIILFCIITPIVTWFAFCLDQRLIERSHRVAVIATALIIIFYSACILLATATIADLSLNSFLTRQITDAAGGYMLIFLPYIGLSALNGYKFLKSHQDSKHFTTRSTRYREWH